MSPRCCCFLGLIFSVEEFLRAFRHSVHGTAAERAFFEETHWSVTAGLDYCSDPRTPVTADFDDATSFPTLSTPAHGRISGRVWFFETTHLV
jgi:hypothetical protein